MRTKKFRPYIGGSSSFLKTRNIKDSERSQRGSLKETQDAGRKKTKTPQSHVNDWTRYPLGAAELETPLISATLRATNRLKIHTREQGRRRRLPCFMSVFLFLSMFLVLVLLLHDRIILMSPCFLFLFQLHTKYGWEWTTKKEINQINRSIDFGFRVEKWCRPQYISQPRSVRDVQCCKSANPIRTRSRWKWSRPWDLSYLKQEGGKRKRTTPIERTLTLICIQLQLHEPVELWSKTNIRKRWRS